MGDKKKKSPLGWWILALIAGTAAISSLGSLNSQESLSNTQEPYIPAESGVANVQQAEPNTTTATASQSSVGASLSNSNYYTNVDGNRIHSPAYSDSIPAGASARCGDGTYSFSQHRQGTCSHHGGVDTWF
jgi:hypothetical protein